MSNESMEESLSIENFGGINSSKIPIARTNVLIGPQASGKSLVAKLMYFCKSYPKDMFSGVVEGYNREALHAKISSRFVEFFGAAIPKSNFAITYRVGDEFVSFKSVSARKTGSKIEFESSDFFVREHATLRRVYGKQAQRFAESGNEEFDSSFRIQHSFFERLQEQMNGIWTAQQIFVPAGRSYFAILQSSIFSLLSSNVLIDPFIREFGSAYERYKSFVVRQESILRHSRIEQELAGQASDFIEDVLKGRYFRKGGDDFIRSKDGREVPISSSSSGQQEALPLLIMLQYFLKVGSHGGRTVYVEEPEAHLFPESQQQLIELLARTLASNRFSSQLVITTHSPYVCATLNNLILAGDVLKKNPSFAARVRKITTMGAFVDFENFSALSMENGNVRSVLDRESRLIDSTYLDNISESLIAQREKLLDVLELA